MASDERSTASTLTLARYLGRVGLPATTPLTVDPATLSTVVRAHVRHIPFEGIDPLLGIPVSDLGTDALARKLVESRRGGFCYEHNGLMQDVLRAIGFDVVALAGRVVWQREPVPLPAETHQLLSVGIPGEGARHLVDVGFGGLTPPNPLLFEVSTEQPTDLESYRVTIVDDATPVPTGHTRLITYAMEAFVAGRWQAIYRFTDVPRPPIDSVAGSWFASTHPTSRFVSGLTAAAVSEAGRINLRGRHLVEHGVDGTTRKTTLDSASAVIDVLEQRFDIAAADVPGLPARIADVLDA